MAFIDSVRRRHDLRRAAGTWPAAAPSRPAEAVPAPRVFGALMECLKKSSPQSAGLFCFCASFAYVSFNDTERAARAREERDFLAAELAGALGLGGRERRLADPSERARKAVTMRIRNSIGRIAKVHPQLARHLGKSVRTGTFCSYEPEAPMEWHT